MTRRNYYPGVAADDAGRDYVDDDDYTYKRQQQGRRLSPTRGSNLSDGLGRLSISAATNPRWGLQDSSPGYDSDHRPPQLFQQWMRGDAGSKAILQKLGYGVKDAPRLQRQSSAPQQKSPSRHGNYNGDAPLVDLHIHIDHNNIGRLSFGMEDKN